MQSSVSLTSKYQPVTIAQFVGLERPRALLSALAAEPYSSAWLLVGPSGLGKTTMALALAKQINGEIHHIPSKECTLATVDEVTSRCWYSPMFGSWHVVLCDEADQMSRAAQLAFLSKLDATATPPNTIFLFTANATRLLEDRFTSRCRIVRFSTTGLAEPATKLLSKIWRKETKAAPPDFDAILKATNYNIRAALMALETEMIMPGAIEEEVLAGQVNMTAPQCDRTGDEEHRKRSEAAQRAWVTIRARRAREGR